MTQRFTEKVTRERLRSLQNGETLTVQCADGYDLASQRNTAYAMGKLENCRFACTADGLKLTVTRYDTDTLSSEVLSMLFMVRAWRPVQTCSRGSQSCGSRYTPVDKYRLVPYPTLICTGYVPSFKARRVSRRKAGLLIC